MKLIIDGIVVIIETGSVGLLVWSWQAAILLVGVWLGLKIFRVKSSAIRHQVWLFGLIAVAILPIWSVMIQFLPLPQPASQALLTAPRFQTGIAGPGQLMAGQISSVSPSPIKVPESFNYMALWRVLFIAWFVGALFVIGRILLNVLKVRKSIIGAKRATLADLDCADCRSRFGRIESARILLSDRIDSPALLGVLRPTIVLPADILEWTTAPERRSIIEHELAHLARRDHYVNLYQTLLSIIFYFHPLVIYACRRLKMEREMACDDHVIDLGAEPETYAESILKVAERNIISGGALQLSIVSTKHILEKRIEMILKNDHPRVIRSSRRHLVLSISMISALVWMLAPALSASAGLRGNNRPYKIFHGNGFVTIDVDLTAEQTEALMRACKPLSQPDGPVLIKISDEHAEEIRSVMRKTENSPHPYKVKLVKTPGGTFVEEMKYPAMSVFAAVENASLISSQLLATSMQFEEPVTLSLTEEQRQQFSQNFYRPITELRFERNKDFNNAGEPIPKSIYQKLTNDLKNIIEPDSYDIHFSRHERGGLRMQVEAKYREIHENLGYLYPKLYPPQDQRSDR